MTKWTPDEPEDLLDLTLPCGAYVVSARRRSLGGYYVDFDQPPRGSEQRVCEGYAFTSYGAHVYHQLPALF